MSRCPRRRPSCITSRLILDRYGRPARRLIVTLVLTWGAIVATTLPAWAATDPTSTVIEEPAGGPAALSWIRIRDSHGISAWSYQLSFGDGGLIPNPAVLIWGYLTTLVWGIYQGVVICAVWAIDYGLSFAWLPVLISPATDIGANLSMVLNRFGLWPAVLTIAAFVTFLWMIRGRWALGIYELAISLIVATLAVGVLANPVAYVAGDDGVLLRSRDAGLGIAAGLARDDLTTPGAGDQVGDPAVNRDAVTAQLVDTFIRTPHQLINFGAVLDGGSCEETYDDALRAGPWLTPEELQEVRTSVADCNASYGAVAETPAIDQVVSALTLAVGGLLLVLLAGLCNFGLLYYCAVALYQAIKLVPMLLLGVLPGSARHGLWRTIADLVMACVAVASNTIFLVGYLIFLQGVFGEDPLLLAPRFVFVDIMLIVGIALFWRLRSRAKEGAAALATWLAWRPGGGSGSPQQPHRTNWLGAAADVANLHRWWRDQRPRSTGAPAPPGDVTQPAQPEIRITQLRSPTTSSSRRSPGQLPPGPDGPAGLPWTPPGKPPAPSGHFAGPARPGRQGLPAAPAATGPGRAVALGARAAGALTTGPQDTENVISSAVRVAGAAARIAGVVGEVGAAAASGGTTAAVSVGARLAATSVASTAASATLRHVIDARTLGSRDGVLPTVPASRPEGFSRVDHNGQTMWVPPSPSTGSTRDRPKPARPAWSVQSLQDELRRRRGGQ